MGSNECLLSLLSTHYSLHSPLSSPVFPQAVDGRVQLARNAGKFGRESTRDPRAGTRRVCGPRAPGRLRGGRTLVLFNEPSQGHHAPVVVESFPELLEVDRGNQLASRVGVAPGVVVLAAIEGVVGITGRPHSSARTRETSCRTGGRPCTGKFRRSSGCRRCRTPILRRRRAVTSPTLRRARSSRRRAVRGTNGNAGR